MFQPKVCQLRLQEGFEEDQTGRTSFNTSYPCCLSQVSCGVFWKGQMIEFNNDHRCLWIKQRSEKTHHHFRYDSPFRFRFYQYVLMDYLFPLHVHWYIFFLETHTVFTKYTNVSGYIYMCVYVFMCLKGSLSGCNLLLGGFMQLISDHVWFAITSFKPNGDC